MSERPEWATGPEWDGWVWVDYFDKFPEGEKGECEPDEGFLERLTKRGIWLGIGSDVDREVNIIRGEDGRFTLTLSVDELSVTFENSHTARQIADLVVSDSSIGGWA